MAPVSHLTVVRGPIDNVCTGKIDRRPANPLAGSESSKNPRLLKASKPIPLSLPRSGCLPQTHFCHLHRAFGGFRRLLGLGFGVGLGLDQIWVV